MYVEYPLGEIKPKEDFVKMLYTILGLFFDHYENWQDALQLEVVDKTKFRIYFHWNLTEEERNKLDRLVRYYNDRRKHSSKP